MKGFFNQILYVDLSIRKAEINTVDKSVYENFLGGKGLATWLLTELNPPGVDPLSPENRLIFATGAVTGTATWGSSRYGVFTKSPLTGFYAESYSGGKVPEAIAATGFDDAVCRRHPESSSPPFPFGGEEGLRQFFGQFFGKTGSVIADAHFHTTIDAPRSDDNCPRPIQCLKGIDQEVL